MSWSAPRTWTDGELVDEDMMNSLRDQLNVLAAQAVGGRLTLTTGVPVTTSDVTAAATLYFTPFRGNLIGLYNTTDSRWTAYSFSEISLSLAGYTASKPYDIWVYDNSGTVTLDSTVWTDGTTRATALALQDGIYVKSGDATRRYLGTIRTTTTTGQCEDSETKRFVWNYYNRTIRNLYVAPPGSSYTYGTSTFRAANNDATQAVYLVAGLAEDAVQLTNTARTSGGTAVICGITPDGTGEPPRSAQQIAKISAIDLAIPSTYVGIPVAGYHYYTRVEWATGTVTFTITNGQGMQGIWSC